VVITGGSGRMDVATVPIGRSDWSLVVGKLSKARLDPPGTQPIGRRIQRKITDLTHPGIASWAANLLVEGGI